MRSLRMVAVWCVIHVSALSAYGITLDEFLGDGSATSSAVGNVATLVTSNPGAIGGNRTLLAVKNSLGSGVTRIETSPDAEFLGDTDYALGYTQGAHTGQGVVTWDGDAQATTLTPNGLGSVDLTQDGGTAMNLGVKFFDYPAQRSIDVTLRLYDSTNPAALKYSDVTITFDRAIDSLAAINLSIPFSKFVTLGTSTISASDGSTFQAQTSFGPGGAIDVTHVGAVQLILNGLTNSNAPDLTLDYLSTNGRCAIVPNSSGRVIDECGVCLNDQNAGNKKDSCGICYYGAPGYTYLPQYDDCKLCPQAPNYGKAKDPCGVCFGDGSTCADCAGTPNGGLTNDVCGVCGGNGTTCLDCKGMPFGTASLDLCGICNGDGKSCADCKGIPNGSAKVDACGVCDGPSSDASVCQSVVPDCVTVKATTEVKTFQRRLQQKAKLIFDKYQEEVQRGIRNGCGINTKKQGSKVLTAYNRIVSRGKEIFSKGVEVCGDSCVTVSYSEQVTKLNPQFRLLEKETETIANNVKKCYQRKKINRLPSTKRVASTLRDVRTGLNQLIEDCRERKVCPPK